ncbi:unnamed protein product [Orchesella dallaii]|uniref:Uncharacterized protein n=1 Tax=Orchesella dallaii TaxID=48710 RepID=A0ABP1S5W0_9HEXA
MSYEENGLVTEKSSESECESSNKSNTINNFSSVIVHGLFEGENNNCGNSSAYTTYTSKASIDIDNSSTNTSTSSTTPIIQGLPEIPHKENDSNLISTFGNGILKQEEELGRQYNYLQVESTSTSSSNFNSLSLTTYSSLEGTSLESASSTTVSFLTEIEIIPSCTTTTTSLGEQNLGSLENERSSSLTMESSVGTPPPPAPSTVANEASSSSTTAAEEQDRNKKEVGVDKQDVPGDPSKGSTEAEQEETGTTTTEEGYYDDGDGGDGREVEDYEDDEDTTTLSSEAVVDDIELILMPEMCQDLPSANLSPKLVRVTELKVNIDDVFCDDDDDEDQSSRHEFRSIVDEVCEEDEGKHDEEDDDNYRRRGEDADAGRFSYGEDDVSSGSELIGRKKGASGGGVSGVGLESSKSSSSSGSRRRRSTSGRINSGVQTDITALEEPSALSGYRRKSSGKSSSGRLGLPSGGKKLNWKSELTLLPSKMKVKQAGFNSFESNDERDQYSPRVAKFTSQDTLNLSSQFLKPSTLYRTRNLSRNLNQFASSESTFMLPMSSEQQLSAESPRFRDRVSSSTSGCNFKGTSTSHSYSAYQISSILSGRDGGGGVSGGGGMGMGYGGGGFGGGGVLSSARRQPSSSGYGGMMMSSSNSRNFRSSMPDLNAVNKSYGTMGDSHRRRQPSKSIKHHHPFSSGFRLQKRSSSDEETSSLIDESERCLRSSIDLLLTDELPSPGGDSCFRSTGFGSSSLAATTTGFYSSRRSCSQPILNEMAYPPELKDPSMGSPFLPRKLSDMRCSRWAKVILPNGHVAIVSVKETDEIQDSLIVHTDTGCVINLPFRKVVFAWKSRR